ncbi:hypothetical protein BJ742DRAFT_396818 [Cladochytrium replicatum]|nr:hypothetical protein BJ742DRAFT_396818 [Cladochytrium replicatum]
MPIALKDHEWRENTTHLYVTLKLPNLAAKDTHVHASDNFLKFSCPPYLFILDLPRTIVPEKSIVSIAKNELSFELLKETSELWNTLQLDPPLSRQELITRREESESRGRDRLLKIHESAVKEKRERERDMVRKQIDVERVQRERIEDMKAAVRAAAEVEFLYTSDFASSVDDQSDLVPDDLLPPSRHSQPEIATAHNVPSTDDEMISYRNEASSDVRHAPVRSLHKTEDEEDGLTPEELAFIQAKVVRAMKPEGRPPPPIRESREIEVGFTSRLPIPTSVARESEDEKWRARIDHFRAAAAQAPPPDPDNVPTQDADTLLSLFNKFYSLENYQAALNALNSAYSLAPSPHLLLHRAAAHLKLQDHNAAVADCTALLIDPDVCNSEMRATAFSRRSMGLLALGEKESALRDLAEASRCSKHPEAKRALEAAREVLHNEMAG